MKKFVAVMVMLGVLGGGPMASSEELPEMTVWNSVIKRVFPIPASPLNKIIIPF